MASRLASFSFVLLLACGPTAPPTDGGVGDASAIDGFVPIDAGRIDGPIMGTASYEDLVPTTSGLARTGPSAPIRRARVRVVSASGAMLGESVTDESGAFRIDIGSVDARGASVEVLATLHTAVLEAYVTDNAETLHVLTVPLTSARADPFASAAAESGRIAGPFNVLDRLARLEDFIRRDAPSGTVLPRVVVHWEVGSTDGTNASHDHDTAFGRGCLVRLLGKVADDDDAFDDTVISHELGHCIAQAFGSDPTAPWANGHDANHPFDPGTAVSEGLATFFGQRMSETALYVDTRGVADGFGYDIDEPAASGRQLGLYGEAAVAGALWDLLDGGAGDDDPFALTPAQFWTVFTEDFRDGQFKSVETLLDGFVARGLVTDAELDTAFAGPLGLNRPAHPSFPLGMLQVGLAVTGDVDATLGYMMEPRGRAEALDLWGIEISSPTTVHIALTNIGGRNDLDLYLQTSERFPVVRSDTTGLGDEAIDATLDPGRYVVAVRAFQGPDAAASYSLVLTTP